MRLAFRLLICRGVEINACSTGEPFEIGEAIIVDSYGAFRRE